MDEEATRDPSRKKRETGLAREEGGKRGCQRNAVGVEDFVTHRLSSYSWVDASSADDFQSFNGSQTYPLANITRRAHRAAALFPMDQNQE